MELYTPLAKEWRRSSESRTHDQVHVIGNDDRLRQVVGNLIDNAIKHTPAYSSIRVTVDRLNNRARIRSADTSAGISGVDLPRVFDRFYRTDPSRSAQFPGGAGLGLSICRSIEEAHGGRIEIQSVHNQGTEVTLLLPDGQAVAESA